MKLDADIVIVGGGPVGGCAGALLARTAEVLLLEAAPQSPRGDPGAPTPTPAAAPALSAPLRVSAVSRASERILEAAGAWDVILAQGASPYERMQVWHESTGPEGATKLRFDAADVGEPNLGWIVENAVIQKAALAAFDANGGRIERSGFRTARFESDHVEIETSDRPLKARLLIGADGARSAVRDAAQLPATASAYRQSAIVATIATERAHEATAWQRFMRSGTIAFLPLSDGSCSIVWSVDEDEARRLIELDAPDFERELTTASDSILGDVKLVSERNQFPLQRLSADRYVAERCALVGDAAHVVHPLAGQGVNLGFLDAASLAQVLGSTWKREDPGALSTLRRYERWRKSENQLMGVAIDSFNRFLAHGNGPVSALARRGLGWVDRSGAAKRLFVRQALGLQGELPEIARKRA